MQAHTGAKLAAANAVATSGQPAPRLGRDKMHGDEVDPNPTRLDTAGSNIRGCHGLLGVCTHSTQQQDVFLRCVTWVFMSSVSGT
jgi:hypothetical protein